MATVFERPFVHFSIMCNSAFSISFYSYSYGFNLPLHIFVSPILFYAMGVYIFSTLHFFLDLLFISAYLIMLAFSDLFAV